MSYNLPCRRVYNLWILYGFNLIEIVNWKEIAKLVILTDIFRTEKKEKKYLF